MSQGPDEFEGVDLSLLEAIEQDPHVGYEIVDGEPVEVPVPPLTPAE